MTVETPPRGLSLPPPVRRPSRPARFVAPGADRHSADDWRHDAECLKHDPELWFSGDPDRIAEAIGICNTCSVIEDCQRLASSWQIRYGVFGGRYFGGGGDR